MTTRVVVLSDIFGLCAGLERLLADLSQAGGDVQLVDPYQGKRQQFAGINEQVAGLIKTAGQRPQFDAGCNCYPKFFSRHFFFRPASAIDSHSPTVDNTSALVRGHGVEPRTASTKAPIMSA